MSDIIHNQTPVAPVEQEPQTNQAPAPQETFSPSDFKAALLAQQEAFDRKLEAMRKDLFARERIEKKPVGRPASKQPA